jgi:hypothetical protein
MLKQNMGNRQMSAEAATAAVAAVSRSPRSSAIVRPVYIGVTSTTAEKTHALPRPITSTRKGARSLRARCRGESGCVCPSEATTPAHQDRCGAQAPTQRLAAALSIEASRAQCRRYTGHPPLWVLPALSPMRVIQTPRFFQFVSTNFTVNTVNGRRNGC